MESQTSIDQRPCVPTMDTLVRYAIIVSECFLPNCLHQSIVWRAMRAGSETAVLRVMLLCITHK